MRAILEERNFPVDEIRYFASARSAGTTLPWRGQDITVEDAALADPTGYPIDRGRIISNRGLDIDAAEYEQHFVEEHVARSNALHSSRVGGGSYLCGPLARFALGYDRLSPLAKEAAADRKSVV